jgi:hypothetical protein
LKFDIDSQRLPPQASIDRSVIVTSPPPRLAVTLSHGRKNVRAMSTPAAMHTMPAVNFFLANICC